MSIELKIPSVGESIREVQIGRWLKHEGDRVTHDEAIVELETDKASMELPSPAAGVLSKILKQDGESVAVGDVIAYLEEGDALGGQKSSAAPPEQSNPATQPDGAQSRSAPTPNQAADKQTASAADEKAPISAAESPDEPAASPSVRRMLREHHLQPHEIKATGEGGRLLREDVLRHVAEQERGTEPEERQKSVVRREDETTPTSTEASPAAPAGAASPTNRPAVAKRSEPANGERVVPMSLIRRLIAERLVEAQANAALLTTFNEIDLSAVIALRSTYRENFQQKYGVKLGFMSFFVKASVDALREFPAVNAEVRGNDIVYHDAYHVGVAIGGRKGLVVPVLRNAEHLSFAEIEQAIDDFAKRAETNKLAPDDLTGGTFTISNGGVYGSLLSTPIVNPPQSGVLGMHAIQDRPVAREGQVVIRPMMYVALTYDHRIIDGREAVSFLKHIKESIEAPDRLLIGV